MNRSVRIVLIVSLIAMASMLAPAVVSAQIGTDILVNQITTLETPSSMTLKVYFNIFDPKTGSPVWDAEPTSAQVTLLNTNVISQAQILQPDVPIYITLLLDSGGRMGWAAPALRQAAKLALNNTPNNSFFSVVQFDESVQLLQDFTQNISAVSYAIDHYKVNPKGTCLYDGAYTAVQSLSKVPSGRRAIILFTDGHDETLYGTPCSKHTFQDLNTFANQEGVPISTIGLSNSLSQINSAELHDMATITGGFSAVGGQSDLSNSFGFIMNALKEQWMAEAVIYPKQGTNNANITVTLKDNTTISKAISITSNTDYPGPPSPVTADFSGLLFHPENNTYDIQLNLTSPALVSSVNVAIWDNKSGSKVAEYDFKDPVANNTFNFPTDQLIVGGDYILHITAVSRSDNTTFNLGQNSQGTPTPEIQHEFTYDPTALSPSIAIQSVAQQGNDLAVTVTTTNIGLIGGFDGWMIDENTNTRVVNSDFKLPALGNSNGTLVIPAGANKIPDGKYTCVIQVLGKNDQVYSTAQYSDVVYTATQPSIFQVTWGALVAAPVLFGLIVAILLGVVGFLIFTSMRSKSITGTPVLQGRLGEKLPGNRSGGPVLPLADSEPIPIRGQSPAAGKPATPPYSPQPPTQSMPSQNNMGNRDGLAMTSAGEENATLIASHPVVMTASLTIVTSPEDASSHGRQVPLTVFPFIIGRTEGNLLIKDASISRRHAQITYDGANRIYFITDLNSSNGTRVNEQRILAGQAVLLTRAAMIGLGPNVTLRFDLS
ncbi:MAG: FHA domain-containing protein [Anaerolineales bacterium]